MNSLFILYGAFVGYVVGIALVVYEPLTRLRAWPHNRRVRKENESYTPPPLPDCWQRACRELTKANLGNADLRGANLSGTNLRFR